MIAPNVIAVCVAEHVEAPVVGCSCCDARVATVREMAAAAYSDSILACAVARAKADEARLDMCRLVEARSGTDMLDFAARTLVAALDERNAALLAKVRAERAYAAATVKMVPS